MNGQLGQGGTRVSPKSQRPLETSKVAAAEIRKETLEKRDRCPSVTLSWYPASYTSLGREVSCTWLWGIPYRLRWVPMALQTTRAEREGNPLSWKRSTSLAHCPFLVPQRCKESADPPYRGP